MRARIAGTVCDHVLKVLYGLEPTFSCACASPQLAAARRSSPQLAAARRSSPQLAAADFSIALCSARVRCGQLTRTVLAGWVCWPGWFAGCCWFALAGGSKLWWLGFRLSQCDLSFISVLSQFLSQCDLSFISVLRRRYFRAFRSYLTPNSR